MFTLSRVAAPAVALAVCLFGSAPAWAESTVLTGMFDGSEPVMGPISDYGCTPGQYGYRQSTFHVSSGGSYIFSNLFEALHYHGGMPVDYRVYKDSFNPADPRQNVMTFWGPSYSLSLTTGINYVLVVQQCNNAEGAWAAGFVGPGSVLSDSTAAVPQFTKGKFTPSDSTKPVSIYGEENGPYKQSGPVRVSRDGTYSFADTFFEGGAQVSLQVYTAPVNPAEPWANLVAGATRGMPLIELHAGQDYYFVTQWIYGVKYGEFQYALAPPAPLRINPGLSGTWYNPDTPGQGFFLTVYEKLNQVFMAWFTYAQDPPAGDDFSHRWMTAFGPFEGPSADLAMEWTAGGAFNAAQPAPEQHVNGSIQLDFSDCATGQITYNWNGDEPGSPPTSGVIPIRRHTDDTVALCESLYAGPGMPGPL